MKRLLLTCCAAATLASCQKDSTLDATLTKNNEMNFSPYAGASVTRGSAVNSNDDFEGTTDAPGSFEIASYLGNQSFFGFNTVTYTGRRWDNIDKMYWPNEDSELHFGAYYPSAAQFTTAPTYTHDDNGHSLKFGYKVYDNVSNQEDLMFSIKDLSYETPEIDDDPAIVNLHFKHALTQVGFTATKSDEISVKVYALRVCNVIKEGDFIATLPTDKNQNNGDITTDQLPGDVNLDNFCTWNLKSTLYNYKSVMNFVDGQPKAITVKDSKEGVWLTSKSDVMMLLPQNLVAWNPKGTTENDAGSYLAIKCKITHHDGDAPIVDGTIYVPFDTKDIPYASGTEDGWKAGHKITYHLHFGGGYTIPGGGEDPKPGTTPKPEDVIPTLRQIKYTVTVDEWIPVKDSSTVL